MSIPYYYSVLNKSQSEKIALQKAKIKLQSIKQEVSNYKSTILVPAIEDGWRGSLAEKWEKNRREDTLSCIESLESNELTTIINEINNKILVLESEISSVQKTITTLKNEQAKG
ncbi:hypothetical protein [Bacillus massilinigeriensis]|uniref:hypothetical protein n=1 Tax=Bacillus mediterraneensis TaxID=1805474 RepID=UPI0008F8D1F7|nr:hypothetical protein [Bacillus mediterraneensis]